MMGKIGTSSGIARCCLLYWHRRRPSLSPKDLGDDRGGYISQVYPLKKLARQSPLKAGLFFDLSSTALVALASNALQDNGDRQFRDQTSGVD